MKARRVFPVIHMSATETQYTVGNQTQVQTLLCHCQPNPAGGYSTPPNTFHTLNTEYLLQAEDATNDK